MNTNILQKCIEELRKEQPSIQYVLGMLETLQEMSGGANQTRDIPVNNIALAPHFSFPPTGKVVSADSPEGMAVEVALARLGSMPQPKVGVMEKNIILN